MENLVEKLNTPTPDSTANQERLEAVTQPAPRRAGALAAAVAAQVAEQEAQREAERADQNAAAESHFDPKRRTFTSGLAKRVAAAIQS